MHLAQKCVALCQRALRRNFRATTRYIDAHAQQKCPQYELVALVRRINGNVRVGLPLHWKVGMYQHPNQNIIRPPAALLSDLGDDACADRLVALADSEPHPELDRRWLDQLNGLRQSITGRFGTHPMHKRALASGKFSFRVTQQHRQVWFPSHAPACVKNRQDRSYASGAATLLLGLYKLFKAEKLIEKKHAVC
jgi:hypothetical protein